MATISPEEAKIIISNVVRQEIELLEDNKLISFSTNKALPEAKELESLFPGYRIDRIYVFNIWNHNEETYQYCIRKRKNKLNELLQVLPEYLKRMEMVDNKNRLTLNTDNNGIITIFFSEVDDGFTIKKCFEFKRSEISGYSSNKIIEEIKKYKIRRYIYHHNILA